MSFLRAGRTGVRFLHNLPAARGSSITAAQCPASASPLLLAASSSPAASIARLPDSAILSIIRTLADKPVGRPKQHTGRSPAKRTTKAAGSKKSSGSTKTAAAKKTKKKAATPKSRADKEKAQVKAAEKREKEKARKALLRTREKARSNVAKEKELVAKLKAESLKDQEPSSRAPGAYLAFYLANFRERKTGGSIAEVSKTLAAEYRGLSPGDRDAWNNRAEESQRAIDAAYRSWLNSFDPQAINRANQARVLLKKRGVRGFKTIRPIKDPRQPKRPGSSYSLFVKERMATGEFKGVPIGDFGKQVGKEWRDMPASEKQRYTDAYKEMLARYRAASGKA